MSHANAALTPKARLALARLVIDEHWPTARAAEYFHVAWPTARRWATRYAALSVLGPVRAADLVDRSSRPHHSPTRTPRHRVKQVVHLRWKRRLSPRAIAGTLGMPASTVHAVLTRCRLNKLSHVDIRTGEVIRRYEHAAPGDLIHPDVDPTSRSSATSPTAAAGATWDAPRVIATAPRHRARPAASITDR